MIGKPRVSNEVVAAMWHDYNTLGISLSSVARTHGKDRRNISEIFACRGLALRPLKYQRPPMDPVTGRILPVPEPAEEEIRISISKLTRFCVPAELRAVWRRWDEKKRAHVIALIRAHFPDKGYRPEKPFSKNVTPFDYSSAAAWKIANRINKGLPSRQWLIHMKVVSQGVIYKGALWFWAQESENYGAYYRGPWTEKDGRPSLHHTIWKEHYGPLPEGMYLTFKDGNCNNLVPGNLKLLAMADNAVRNVVNAPTHRLSREPGNLELQGKILQIVAKAMKTRHANSRKKTEMLLNHHNSGQRSMAAQLTK